MLSSLVIPDPLGVTDELLKLQLASGGCPLQISFTGEEENPLTGAIVTVAVPVWPATIVMVVGLTLMTKVGIGQALTRLLMFAEPIPVARS
jgi:hypothetical protein